MLEKALDEGHLVTALVRSPAKLVADEKLTIIQGDVRNEQDVSKTISGMDVVLRALWTDKTTTLSEAIQHMIESMNKRSINRIVTIGTAGILESRVEPGKLRYEDKDSFRQSTFSVKEHHKIYDLLS